MEEEKIDGDGERWLPPPHIELPTVNNVAGLYSVHDGLPIGDQNIIVYPFEREKQQFRYRIVPNLSTTLDPLSYALLFPYGDEGWNP